MVWQKRKIIILLVAVAVLMAMPWTASAASIYTDGNISSTYTTIFEDVYISPLEDYVYFRSGQYTYTLIVGDLTLNGSQFSSNYSVKNYTINTQSGSGYNNNIYKYSVSEESRFSLDAQEYLVYSNLGNYPQLGERGDNYEIFTAFMLCIALGLYALRSVFGFSLRTRH